eukprot:m.24759 g.24759  ORF g.24759 m.24759 type:complete len:583 (-) comp8760_c0_seq1:172-1920(-)
MPPKKKKVAKKGAKLKKGAKKKEGPIHLKRANVDELALVKEFFLLQVADLENRLRQAIADYEEANDKYKKLDAIHTQETTNLKDILEFHKREYGKLTEQLATSKEKYILFERELEAKVKAQEKAHAQEKAAFLKQLDVLQGEVNVRDRKLLALEEFRVREAALSARMADLSAQLQEQEEQHRAAIDRIEKNALAEKEKLRVQLSARVDAVTTAFHKQVLAEMPDTARRLLAENITMNNHIATLSEQSVGLIDANDRLRQSREAIRAELMVAAAGERARARQYTAQQHVMTTLETRLKEVEAQAGLASEQTAALRVAQVGEIQTLINSHTAELQQAHEALAAAEEHARASAAESAQARAELQELGQSLEAVKRKLSTFIEEARVSRTSLLRSSIDSEDSPAFVTAAAELERVVVSLTSALELLQAPALPPDAIYEPGKLGLVPGPRRVLRRATSAQTVGEPVSPLRRTQRPSSAATPPMTTTTLISGPSTPSALSGTAPAALSSNPGAASTSVGVSSGIAGIGVGVGVGVSAAATAAAAAAGPRSSVGAVTPLPPPRRPESRSSLRPGSAATRRTQSLSYLLA